jgi:coproporphyrinogen III oxidase
MIDLPSIPASDLGRRAFAYFRELQERICAACEEIDGAVTFSRDSWDRPDGGGGLSRVIEDGAVFEKAGVNTSAVFGMMPGTIARKMNVEPANFFATGVSLVLHPRSPLIPTVHANFRYFEQDDGDAWFGGGTDLTPYYLFEEDAVHFHKVLKDACDRVDPEYYPRFKQWCDEYFFVRHRGESRGVGGIFFDYLRGEHERHFALVCAAGDAFLNAYVPIVRKHRTEAWGDRERSWQLLRRGRYVEFNLVYDRGTAFGLETGGRIESILMSLPPLVQWRYNYAPEQGSPEASLLEVLREPRQWV